MLVVFDVFPFEGIAATAVQISKTSLWFAAVHLPTTLFTDSGNKIHRVVLLEEYCERWC